MVQVYFYGVPGITTACFVYSCFLKKCDSREQMCLFALQENPIYTLTLKCSSKVLVSLLVSYGISSSCLYNGNLKQRVGLWQIIDVSTLDKDMLASATVSC